MDVSSSTPLLSRLRGVFLPRGSCFWHRGRWASPSLCDAPGPNVADVTAQLATSRKAMKGSPSLSRKMSPMLWRNCNWPSCTSHSSQREDRGGCRVGRLLACGLVNPTTNRKTAKQNGTMTEAHQDQRTSIPPRQPRAIINAEIKPKLQLKLCFRQREREINVLLRRRRLGAFGAFTLCPETNRLVPSRHVQDPVRVDVESDFNLRHATWR